MATIKHARTIALQATSPRIVAVPLPINITADWTTNVTGTGKPADDATKNRIQTGTSFSGTPVNGDIWIDTNTSPAIVKTRIAGAWVSSANYTTNTTQLTDGAGLGTTATWAGVTGTGKPSSYADVTTTIMGNSGTSILMTASNLFKSASGLGGVFIGSGGLFGKNTSGVTTFSIDGATGAAVFAGSLSAATGTFAGSLSAATGSFAGSLSAATGSFGAVTAGGAVTVNTSGSISNGISYGGTGFFLGYSGSAYKFSVGDATKYLRWDGSALTFAGALSGATGTFSGTLSAATGTFSGTLSAGGISITGTSGASMIFSTASSAVNLGNVIAAGYVEATAGSAAKPAVYGYQTHNALAVHGATTSSGGGAHGVRGECGYNGATGIVGCANGYDFYADGAGTNYGPFTGSHDALVLKGAALEEGDIVCDMGVAVRKNVSNTICYVALSNAPAMAAAVGVVAGPARALLDDGDLPAALRDSFTSIDPTGAVIRTMIPAPEFADLRWTHDTVAINAVGEGMVNVTGEGGNLLPGDLITTSSTPGKGMRQADDVVRASSVAKCREAVTFDNPDQVRMVACIYLCG